VNATGLRALEFFVGEWRVSASFPSGAPPSLAGSEIVGDAVFEWVLNGQFLAGRVEMPDPNLPDSSTIVGLDAEDQAFTQHYFDSRGVARVYAMTYSDGVWTLLREKPDFTPLNFAQRFKGAVSDDGGTITGRWETRRDDADWKHDFDLTYTKIS
jgi:hypothetical protein